MPHRVEPLAQITERAIQILHRELGVADTARFLSQFRRGTGDYTRERDALFAGVTLEEILTEMRNLDDVGHA